MRASIRVGRIAGIPIGLHYSWFIIATLITMSLAAHFSSTNPAWGAVLIWLAAVVTSLLFFATLVAHELAHALVARSRHVPVRSITLFALGGIAQIEKDAGSARTEFWMGIAGPITSALIGLTCMRFAAELGWDVTGEAPGALAAMLGWLGSINVVLAVFNLIPGYPLDGGRVLRAILWGIYGDVDRATRAAAQIGQFVAGAFILVGLFRFFGGAGFAGLWLAFIGWVLLAAARASYDEVAITANLRHVTTADLMADECHIVNGDTTLSRLADEAVRSGHRCFMVTRDDGRVVGLITPRDVGHVDRRRWPSTRVSDAMHPLDHLKTVTPTTPATEVLRIMSREDLNQLPVVSGGRLAGVITRTDLLRLIQNRSELNL